MEERELSEPQQGIKKRKIYLYLAGIIAFSFCLRAPITSVGPLVTTIGTDLHVNSSMMGMITTLPVLTFGLCSSLVGKLAHRLGASNTIVTGLLFVAAGGFIRSFLGIGGLWVGTILVGMGICAGNVLIPSIIKQRFPGQVGILTSVYTTTMGIFAAIGAGASIPLSQGLGLGWRLALAVWSVVALAAAILWVPQLGGKKKTAQEAHGDSPKADHGSGRSVGTSCRPPKTDRSNLWRSKTAWYMTLFMGLQSLLFYSVTSWMPTIVQSQGLSQQAAGTMALLFQLVGLPITFLTPILTERMRRQEGLVVIMGLLYFGGLFLLVFAPGQLFAVTLGVILMSVCACGAFAWAMATIGLRTSSGGEAAVLSGMVQSVGYLLAAMGPLLSGVIFDLLGSWNWTLLFYFVAALGMTVFGVLAARRKSL